MVDQAGLSEMAQSHNLASCQCPHWSNSNEKFCVFPDDMAKQIGGAYNSFAMNVKEAMADPAEVELAA